MGRAVSSTVCAAALLFVVGVAGCGTTASQAEPAPGAKKPPAPVSYFVYRVQQGDTLYALGERFHVSSQELADLNSVDRPDKLRIGMPLLVPQAEGVKAAEPPAPRPRPTEAVRQAVARSDLHRGKPSAQFWWPTQGCVVRHYGDRIRGLADAGIGIAAPAGLEVYAVAGGTVTTCARSGSASGSAWGNAVAISHAGGMVSWYAQLGRILVEEGTRVKKGQAIGTVGVGADGRPGIAFRLFREDRPVDPEDYLP